MAEGLTNIQWSDLDIESALEETDKAVGLVGGKNAQILMSALREILNKADQNIIGNLSATGDVSATNLFGDIAGTTGSGGTGGVINDGSTTIGADAN
ncbi:hypothetical protein KAR91_00710, partial [Candidatus Pacearchaeota archaeon]|nr:hypothetical protein [Candidatus Pacearchaeota archaeon]